MSDSADFLRILNPQQCAAAEHLAGPLLVIAGAGTGKTKTLAARVANLIRSGADPDKILLLTFTRRAAAEMLRRAGMAVGDAAANAVWGGTFHSIAHRLLRQYSHSLGLDANFVILDQGDAEDLLQLIRTDLELHEARTRFPKKGTLLAIYSRCVNSRQPLEQVLEGTYAWCQDHLSQIKHVFTEYTKRKLQRNLLDYDDLLLYLDHALTADDVGTSIASNFQHVLVDEYQDTNLVQASLLQKLWKSMNAVEPAAKDTGTAATARSIMVVGDDAQSIYAFRGASVENILRFPEQFSGATLVRLEQNYRSTSPILAVANAVMLPAKRQFTKNLWSQRTGTQKPLLVTCGNELDQARYIADKILEQREEGIALTRQAVLFRAGHNSDALEVELQRRNIPFVKWGGMKFLEAAHVKDLLAFLRILENPRDELSWMRILQLLEGVGPGRARQAISHLEQRQEGHKGILSWKAPAQVQEQVRQLGEVLLELTGDAQPLTVEINRLRRYYNPLLERHYENAEMRARDLDQLELLARPAASRAAFLADLTLDPPASTGDLAGRPLRDEEYLVLSTIHSAKGCEWDAAFVIQAADGVIPSDMAEDEAELEEERRLFYVAITRAKDRLHVTFPLRYYHRKHALGDSHSFAQLSRFLPPVLFPLFDCQSFTANDRNVSNAVADVRITAGVQASLRHLW
jgi:DNA helicase-2/ATP-dependent DNA helicase PcrA